MRRRRRSSPSLSSPRALMLQPLQQEGRWRRRLPERWSRRSTCSGRRCRGGGALSDTRQRGPGAEEWSAKVDGATTWPADAAPADNAGSRLRQKTTPRRRRRTRQRVPVGSLAPSPRRRTEKVEAVALEAKRTLWSDCLDHTTNNAATRQQKRGE